MENDSWRKLTPFRPMYSAIWPLDMAPTIAPTLDKEPNIEYWTKNQISKDQCDIGGKNRRHYESTPRRLWVEDPSLSKIAWEMNSHTAPSNVKLCWNSIKFLSWFFLYSNEYTLEDPETMITVKPNWIGPSATIKTQARTETELSRMAWEDPIILDCLDPIRYQLPVCRNGFLRSLASSFSSLKLISSALLQIDDDLLRHFPIKKKKNRFRNQMPICWPDRQRIRRNLERNEGYFSLQWEKGKEKWQEIEMGEGGRDHPAVVC